MSNQCYWAYFLGIDHNQYRLDLWVSNQIQVQSHSCPQNIISRYLFVATVDSPWNSSIVFWHSFWYSIDHKLVTIHKLIRPLQILSIVFHWPQTKFRWNKMYLLYRWHRIHSILFCPFCRTRLILQLCCITSFTRSCWFSIIFSPHLILHPKTGSSPSEVYVSGIDMSCSSCISLFTFHAVASIVKHRSRKNDEQKSWKFGLHLYVFCFTCSQ